MSSHDNLLETITTTLEQFIAKNDQTGAHGVPTCFDAKDPPPITLRNYVARLEKYLRCSNECYLIALIFIDRMTQRKKIQISSLNVHRMLLTAVIVAAKMRDDIYYANKYYAQAGGVDVKELNDLEGNLLTYLDWKTYVSYEDYCRFLHELRTRYGEFGGKTGELLAEWEQTPEARAYQAECRSMAGNVSSGESSSASQADEEEAGLCQQDEDAEVCMRGCPLSMDSVVDSVHNVSSIGNSTGDSGDDDAEMCDDSGSFGSYYQTQQTEQWARVNQYNAYMAHGLYHPSEPCRYEQQWAYGGWEYASHQGYGY